MRCNENRVQVRLRLVDSSSSFYRLNHAWIIALALIQQRSETINVLKFSLIPGSIDTGLDQCLQRILQRYNDGFCQYGAIISIQRHTAIDAPRPVVHKVVVASQAQSRHTIEAGRRDGLRAARILEEPTTWIISVGTWDALKQLSMQPY